MATSTLPSAAGDDGAPILLRSASTIVATVAKGSHVVNIDGYSRMNETIRTGSCTKSCTFDVGGHQWCITYYPNGINPECADCISVFLDHVSPAEDVNAEFQFDLLDGGGRIVPSYSRTAKRTFAKHELRWGCSRFVKREELEKSDHLKNDRFTIQCDVTVLKELLVKEQVESFVEVPPSNLHRHLGDLLLNQKEGADVTFKVGPEKFVAHRCVLAARSPVFKAELFGSMKEKDARSICINDMDASVFEALLHFVYTDELPEINEEDAAAIAQHLLVAADRYDMERLKLICEDKLCRCLDVKTAANTLALAEQHHCRGLKKAILKFLTSPRNLKEIGRAHV